MTASPSPEELKPLSDLRFTIDRETFANAINWVARTLPSRPLNPTLGGIHLTTDTDDGTLCLQAYDYEVSAAIRLPAAEVHSPGASLVSGRLLAAISRAFPKKPVEFSHNGTVAGIKCGTADFALPTMHAEDFPLLPTHPAVTGMVDAEVFAEAAAQTVVAASRDGAVMQIACVCVEITDDDTLTLFATDKHRIAMRQLPWTPAGPRDTSVRDAPLYQVGARFLVPTRAIGEIGRMGGAEVALSFADNLLGISGDERRTTTRLIDAQFPDARRVMPTEHTAIAVVNVAEVAEAVNRAALLDEREFPRVRLEFNQDVLHLSGGKEGIGAIREDIAIDFAGEPIALWVNPKYLTDALAALRAGKGYVAFTGTKRPIMFAAYDGDPVGGAGPFPGLLEHVQPNYVHLVMPTAGDARTA
ncbi:MAG: DNA polymerase III subunit beta [Mycobacterium sp.]|nr:MAG: DNA polymerase III subunit beta [Mycobacterium sp.]